MLKIGFDISQLAHSGGVATYTKELANQLSKTEDFEVVYFYSSLRKPYHGQLKNVKKYQLPPSLFEILFNRIRNTDIEKFIGPVDIFHSSDWIQPPAKAKKVTTYFDVVPLKYPQWSHPKIVSVSKRRLKLVEKEIDMVIAISQSTKNDLLEVSNIPSEKIEVIYLGADKRFKPQPQPKIRKFKERYNLPNEFVLAIGGVGTRKNLKRIKEACKDYNLVITGETLVFPEDEMPLLYSAARVLLYPSLYEGFGLPILEAMACGTPVITSNVSSMPEVGGEAALYVNPERVDGIKNTLGEVMLDQKLRSSMIKKGFTMSSSFSWEKCAKETTALYRDLIQNS